MTHKERFITAIERGIPDRVPTFELEFQLEKEMFGETFDYTLVTEKSLAECSKGEKEIRLGNLAEHIARLYLERLEYDSIPLCGSYYPQGEAHLEFVKVLRKTIGDSACMHWNGDGTYAIPDGNEMYNFAYKLADDYQGVLDGAEKKVQKAIEKNKRYADAGLDVFILCSDYCYNTGPFVSPKMFSEIIAPYLARLIEEVRKMGCYAIKHTDGNIMPIIDQLVQANPHAIHSLDPMAGVDIKTVKELYGDKVALCGNVNCALMQTGTEEEVLQSAEYCMTHGKPNGGYVFCTSNVPFTGLPVRKYEIVLDFWRKNRDY